MSYVAKLCSRYDASLAVPVRVLIIVQKLWEALPQATESDLLGNIASLSELARHAPDVFEEKSDVVVAYLLRDLLLRQPEEDEVQLTILTEAERPLIIVQVPMDVEDRWVEYDDLDSDTIAKCSVLKLFTNRCLANADSPDALHAATPIIKLLYTILQNDGSFSPQDNARESCVFQLVSTPLYSTSFTHSPAARPHFRLRAGISLMKLATIEKYYRLLLPQFTLLAAISQVLSSSYAWDYV